eukprot:CAMPEP_0172330360 /NCGR_PEP_ID=MMETSP1058-20130122/61360_1 /TAXON_ID=83371 /ORGANISM="Detonula confervacea, Strain CCMP 353" /LENGTH=71 /DNA_ID=CAMNT_0013047567 /DNA_START=849 /DNA_END=1064 /DNA_ORIENTATION=-
MCRVEVEARQQEDGGIIAMKGRRDHMICRSPSIVMPHLEKMSKQIKVLQRQNYRSKDGMMEKDKGDSEIIL